MIQNKNVSSTLYIVLCNVKPKKKKGKISRGWKWGQRATNPRKGLDSFLGKCKINNNDTSHGHFVLEFMQI